MDKTKTTEYAALQATLTTALATGTDGEVLAARRAVSSYLRGGVTLGRLTTADLPGLGITGLKG
jgi:hypothetical protein